jgi:hypothetical protein
MKKVFLCLALIFITFCLSSQATKFGFQTGLHFSNMQELSDLNLILQKETPFDTKIISDFPGYWYYKPSINLEYSNLSLGVSYFFTSTGSRISSKDFSGEYKLDIKVHTSAPAIFADAHFPSKSKLQGGFKCSLGILLSGLNMNESLIVGNQSIVSNDNNFESLNYFFLPEFRVTYPWKSFSFEFNTGYLIQFGAKQFSLKDNKNTVLTNPDIDNPIKPNWNGFEIGISITYSLKRHRLQIQP